MSNTALDPASWWPVPDGPKRIGWIWDFTNSCSYGGNRGPKPSPHNCSGIVQRRPFEDNVRCGCPCHYQEQITDEALKPMRSFSGD